jgi:YbbR domain-containing protein
MNFVRVFINLFQFNRTNWKAAMLCFLAAAIFWIFNAFNKSHSSTIRFPLQFSYDNQRFVPISPLPHNVSINVSSTGWDLMRKTVGFKFPELIIPLERPLETKKIPANTLSSLLISQMGGMQINYVATDTLHIHLDEKMSKTFRLAVDMSRLKFREGFGNTGPVVVVPDSVVIDGPSSLVKALPDTISIPARGTQINKSFQDELEVPLINSASLNRNPPVVTVKIEVGPIETMEAMIKVKTINWPRPFRSVRTDSVKISVQVPAAQREDFKGKLSEIHALLDLKDIAKGSHQVTPTIIGLPIYARVISIGSVSFKID